MHIARIGIGDLGRVSGGLSGGLSGDWFSPRSHGGPCSEHRHPAPQDSVERVDLEASPAVGR